MLLSMLVFLMAPLGAINMTTSTLSSGVDIICLLPVRALTFLALYLKFSFLFFQTYLLEHGAYELMDSNLLSSVLSSPINRHCTTGVVI
jgi:hypothetical protein